MHRSAGMSYVGPERRIHKVYVTRNTEYHVRRNVCVAVRDRISGQWCPRHGSIGMALTGAVSAAGQGGPVVLERPPGAGERLCFGDLALITSPLAEVRRPPRDVVLTYPLERAG